MALEPDIRVGPVEACRVGGRHRVGAVVAGRPVFFESADAELVPNPDAFASLFLLPALDRGVRLRLDDAPSARWHANAAQLVRLFRAWWGYTGPDPLERIPLRPDAGPPREAGGQCFSAGLDSFYTLFRSVHRRDALVFLHGFDVALEDEARLRTCERSLRTVASATGRRALLVRTSARRHPLVRAVRWDRMHGAVLAAAGHVLCGEIGSLVIPASWSHDWRAPWGSHWDSDPLWSGDRLNVIHDDATLQRWDKLPAIADEPLLIPHLRVCWENLDPSANCGRCEKCVRTRVLFLRWQLYELGERAFASRFPLVETIDRMDPLTPAQRTWVWEPYYARWPLPADVHDAIVRLIERSRRAETAGMAARMARRLRQIVHRLAGPVPIRP